MNKKNVAAIKKYQNYFDTLAHEKAKLQTFNQKTKFSNNITNLVMNPEIKPEVKLEKFLEKYMYQGDIQFGKTIELPFLQNSNDMLNKLVLKNEFTNKTDNTEIDIFDINFRETYKIDYKIMINHKRKAYLNKYEHQPMYDNWKGIDFFSNNNYDGQQIDANKIIHNLPGKIINSKFVKYLTDNVQVINEAVYIYNIIFPNHDICEYHKEHMRGILEPTEYMASLIEITMNNLNLVKNNYTVIHIRSGDKYLKDGRTDFNDQYINFQRVYLLYKNIDNN